jgi:hypothetical protein
MTKYELFVPWRFITSPDVEETERGLPYAHLPVEEVPEDAYHPDKMISVGPDFDTAEAAALYALARGWTVEDADIRPYEVGAKRE